MAHFLGLSLGNLPVLAVQAPKITSRRGDGKDPGTGIKMKQRLFLNRIHMHRTGIPIGQGIKLAIDIYLGPADASIPWLEVAPIRADLTLYIPAIGGIVVAFHRPFPGPFWRITLKNMPFDTLTRTPFKKCIGITGAKEGNSPRSQGLQKFLSGHLGRHF